MGKLIVAGFMAGVVAVECLLAYLFIPSAEEVALLAEQNMSRKLPITLAGDDLTQSSQHPHDAIEIDLGEYGITVSQRNANTVLRVDFHLVGTVLDEHESAMQRHMERKKSRFREIVLYEIRNSEREDLDDPQLGLIKRRILEKSNALLGKPLLQSIVFSQFSYIEQ